MNMRWQNKTAKQIYRMGEHREGADMPSQDIDYLWEAGGRDNIGYLKSCDHGAKITIHGPDCVALAERIIAALNATI